MSKKYNKAEFKTTIEDGIPAPTSKRGFGPIRLAIMRLKVGQSAKLIGTLNPGAVQSTVMRLPKTKECKGSKYISRKIENGFRVWRVK